VHVRLRSLKNGPVVRNRLRLPHPVKTDIRICVIAAPDSKAAAEARAAGATLVGEDDIFNQIKEGIVEFDRCICHADSLQKMNKARLGQILGPKGMMPSAKAGTVVTQVGASVRNMVGASEYRERLGVVRMAVGQLAFTPEEMSNNIKAFMDALKKDMAQMSDRITKEVHEVVCCPILDTRDWATANNALGAQLDQRAWLHAQRRLQERQLNTRQGPFWAPVNSCCSFYAVQTMYHIISYYIMSTPSLCCHSLFTSS
jgi:ribosomal protein L1